MPYNCNFFIKMSLSTVSKALAKSMNITMAVCLLSRQLYSRLLRFRIASCVERFFKNPYCAGVMIELWWTKLISLLNNTRSKSLLRYGSTEIGR